MSNERLKGGIKYEEGFRHSMGSAHTVGLQIHSTPD